MRNYLFLSKNADLADLETVMENVYYKKEEISACIDDFYNRMMARSIDMKKMPHYKTGENYAYLGLEPNFLVFDEYVAYMEMLSAKENMAVMNKLKQIVMLGRQAGFYIILACQRPKNGTFQDDRVSVAFSRGTVHDDFNLLAFASSKKISF